MFKRCSHQWVEVSRKFTSPVTNLRNMRNTSAEVAYDILYGFTIVEFKCQNCGKLDFDKIPEDQR